MLLHLIGPYQFHGLRGPIDFPQANIAVETRPNVNGATLWDMGTWGRPFDVESTVFTANYYTALSTFASYKLATAMNPLQLTIGSVTIPWGLFQVMSVDPVRVEALMKGHVAGDSTLYQGIVVARWVLFPIANDN